jgi:nucleoporin POM152
MNGTPLLSSAFPQTPKTIPGTGRRKLFETPSRSQPRDNRPVRTPHRSATKSPSKLSKLPPPSANNDVPLIPTTLIDAPSQRLYVVAIYIALNAWRIYESLTASDDLDSTWLLLKWATIDGIFLVGLQALRIPWLEWAFPTTLTLFLLHAVGNVFLMFRIPVCLAFFFPILPFGLLIHPC